MVISFTVPVFEKTIFHYNEEEMGQFLSKPFLKEARSKEELLIDWL